MNSNSSVCDIHNIHYEIINNILTSDNLKTLCIDQIKHEEPNQTNKTALIRFSRHISLENYFDNITSETRNNEDTPTDNISNLLNELSSISSVDVSESDDTILILQLSSIVDKLLSELSPSDKQIYLYRYFFAYSVADVAGLSNTVASNVEKVISQCNNKLKELIHSNSLNADNKSLLLSFTDIDDSHLLSLTPVTTSKKTSDTPENTSVKKKKIPSSKLLNIILSSALVLAIIIIVIQYTNFSNFLKDNDYFATMVNNSSDIDIDDFYIEVNGKKVVDGNKLYEIGSLYNSTFMAVEYTINEYTGTYEPMVLPEDVPLHEFIGDEIPELSTKTQKFYRLYGSKNNRYIISEYKNEYQFHALSLTRISDGITAIDTYSPITYGQLLSDFYGYSSYKDIEEFSVMLIYQDSGYADCHTSKLIGDSMDIQLLFETISNSTYTGESLGLYLAQHNLGYSYVYSNSVRLFIHGKDNSFMDRLIYYPNGNFFIDITYDLIYRPTSAYTDTYISELLRFFPQVEEPQDPELWDFSITTPMADTSDPRLTLTITSSSTTNTRGKYVGSDFTIEILENNKWVPLPLKYDEEKITNIPFFTRLDPNGIDTNVDIFITDKYKSLEPGNYRVTLTIYDSNTDDLNNPPHKKITGEFRVMHEIQ